MDLKLCIEASAGSGKTYKLAQRYIQILSEFKPKNLSSIVAITFTNKAAAEMKERIVLFLKTLSKIYGTIDFKTDDFSISDKQAFFYLIKLIKEQSDFYVTTIDAFMNKILKAVSVDLNILPDYDVSFDSEEIFQLAFNDLISDKENHKELLEMVKSLLFLEKSGFNGENILKKSFESFRNYEIPENILTTKDLLNNSKYNEFYEKFNEKVKKLQEDLVCIIEKNSEKFNGNRKKTYLNLNVKKFTDKLEEIKNFIKTEDISFLLKKNQQISPSDINDFCNILKEYYQLYCKYVIVKNVYYTEIIVSPLKKLKNYENRLKSYLNIVDWNIVTKLIGDILEEKGANYAYCRLGETVNHYLIDEFQDTSKEQFKALFPLIENAVAKGGSLFVVGDKKQAIYGWRGGDYTVFDDLNNRDKVNFSVTTETIDKNFRSEKIIVKFNNRIFNIDNLLKTLPEKEYIQEIKHDLENFKSSYQNSLRTEEKGYVNVILKNTKEKDEFYREKLKEILKRAINEKNIDFSRIMILLRRKDDIATVVEWLREDFPDVDFITEDTLSLIKNFEIKKILLIASAVIGDFDNGYIRALEEVGIEISNFDELKLKSKILSSYEFFCFILENNYLDYENNKVYFDLFLEKVLELSDEKKSIDEIINYFYENEDITVKIPEETEALKIMTIHKAKGLESHTVIIPFYEWKLTSSNSDIYAKVNVKEMLDEDKFIFTKINKELYTLIPEAKKIYMKKMAMEFMESLNLMYVANTRAEKNLFIIGAFSTVKGDKLSPVSITASSMLLNILYPEKETFYLDEEIVYETGIFEKEKTEEKLIKKPDITHLQHRATIRKHLKFYPEVYEINFYDDNKVFGELFHLTMENIDISDNVNQDNIIKKAYLKAVRSLKYENDEVIELVKDTIMNLKEYFFDIEEYWNEKEIIDKKGNVFRIDRIVKKNNEFTIIDYKTGDFDSKHVAQVKNYLTFFPLAKGVLYYANKREIKYVD